MKKGGKSGYMSLGQVREIIFTEVRKSGYVMEERLSSVTTSRYYMIKSETQVVEFRVADHPGNTNMLTLRTDHKLSKESVTGFINNRIKALSLKSTMTILEGRV